MLRMIEDDHPQSHGEVADRVCKQKMHGWWTRPHSQSIKQSRRAHSKCKHRKKEVPRGSVMGGGLISFLETQHDRELLKCLYTNTCSLRTQQKE